MPDRRIILGVTGSVAAKLTPKLARALQSVGKVEVVATASCRYFFNEETLRQTSCPLWRDADEWKGDFYQREQDIPHISLGDRGDLLVIAPLSAKTLTKIALGLTDNLLTCLYYAWPSEKPVIIAPAMNTRMWENPLTKQHLDTLLERPHHHMVPPVHKRLACGVEGVGAMAPFDDIIQACQTALSNLSSP